MAEVRRGKRQLMAVRAFIDDSGSGGDSPYYVLAGYLGDVPTWERFTEDWQQVLDKVPKIAYFKMSEAESQTGEFEQFTHPQRDERVDDLVAVVEKHHLWAACCAISKPDFDELIVSRGAGPWRDPYITAFMYLIGIFTSIGARFGFNDIVDFIFDEPEKGQKRTVRDIWDQVKGFQPVAGRVGVIEFRDDKDFLPLQAADLLAWHERRHRSNPAKPARPVYNTLHENSGRYWEQVFERADLEQQLANLYMMEAFENRTGVNLTKEIACSDRSDWGVKIETRLRNLMDNDTTQAPDPGRAAQKVGHSPLRK
jgi:hypothetical protein